MLIQNKFEYIFTKILINLNPKLNLNLMTLDCGKYFSIKFS